VLLNVHSVGPRCVLLFLFLQFNSASVQDVAYGALTSAPEGTRFKSDPGPPPTLQSISIVLPEASDSGEDHPACLCSLQASLLHRPAMYPLTRRADLLALALIHTRLQCYAWL
jgi:hypothetical protein